MKKFLGYTLAGLIGGISSLAVYNHYLSPNSAANDGPLVQTIPVRYTNNTLPSSFETTPAVDFTAAAGKSVDRVVHIRTEMNRTKNMPRDPFHEFFFGMPGGSRPVMGSGSGVIISEDGYIVTNNHVIDGADKVSVTLNNKYAYDAKVIGTDPSTDLALIKIEEDNLPFMEFANSDDVVVGEWVMAVGNPFNLNSTVTAGIVSAKTRRIDIIEKEMAIESFIQTDAAVNQGNSGGALVNTRGELIGINSAIASTTGSYAGYSFAIPSNLVKKVVNDLAEFGKVQRAFLGIVIKDITPELAKKYSLKDLNGVYVEETTENGGAGAAGIKKGDIIRKVGDVRVNGFNALQEQIGLYRPGDRVNITLTRDGEEKTVGVTLKNREGSTVLYKRNEEIFNLLGAELESFKNAYGNVQGLKITKLQSGKLKAAGIKEGFLITKINGTAVREKSDVEDIISKSDGSVYIEGIYPNGQKAYYAFGM